MARKSNYQVVYYYSRSDDGRSWANGHPPGPTYKIVSEHGTLAGAVRAAVALVGSRGGMGTVLDAAVKSGIRTHISLSLDRDGEMQIGEGTRRAVALARRPMP